MRLYNQPRKHNQKWIHGLMGKPDYATDVPAVPLILAVMMLNVLSRCFCIKVIS